MSKLYIARHRDFDMYWGRKCGKSMWINDISSATVMTKKQWKEFMKANETMKDLLAIEGINSSSDFIIYLNGVVEGMNINE